MTKKILSIFTTLVVMFSLTGVLPAVTASADIADSDYNDNNTYTELVLGENTTISTSDYDYVHYYSFTPET